MQLLKWGTWEGNQLEGGGEMMTDFEGNVEEAELRKGMKALAY